MKDLDQYFNALKKAWPSSLVARSQVGRFSGGVVAPGHLANCDFKGIGPAERIRIGRKIAYPVDSLIKWLKEKSEMLDRVKETDAKV